MASEKVGGFNKSSNRINTEIIGVKNQMTFFEKTSNMMSFATASNSKKK